MKPFPAEEGLSFASLEANRATIDNIRLWDVQPLMNTYAQLQEIRTYYRFLDMDIDRYRLDGAYQQVMLSARELEPALLPSNAQTWVNLHLLFTHGNGVVMSPVTREEQRRPAAASICRTFRRSPPAVPPSASRASISARPSEGYVDRQGQHARVRLSQGQGQRLCRLRRRRRRRHRRHGAARPLRLVLRRSQHPAHRATSPARAGSCFIATSRTGCARSRPFLQPRPRSLYRGERRAPVLDAGRLHHQRLVSLCPAAIRRRPQLHPQLGQGGDRRLQRHGRLLCQRSRRSDHQDLPAHLPGPVQAAGGDAARPAAAHPLPRGSVPRPGAALPHLSHGQGRRFSTIARISGSSRASPPTATPWLRPRRPAHGALLHDHAAARRAAAPSSSSCCRWCRASART